MDSNPLAERRTAERYLPGMKWLRRCRQIGRWSSCLICTSRRALVRLSQVAARRSVRRARFANSQWKCCMDWHVVKFNLSLLWSMNGRWLSPDKVGTISVTLYFPKTMGQHFITACQFYNVAATVAATGANPMRYNCSCNIENLGTYRISNLLYHRNGKPINSSFASRDELESPDYSVPPFISAPPRSSGIRVVGRGSIIPLIGKKVRKYFGFSNLVTIYRIKRPKPARLALLDLH